MVLTKENNLTQIEQVSLATAQVGFFSELSLCGLLGIFTSLNSTARRNEFS